MVCVFQTARKVTAAISCCNVLGDAAAAVINEIRNPHRVAISCSCTLVYLPSSSRFWTCWMCWSSSLCLSAGMVFLRLVTHVLIDIMLVGGGCPVCLMTLKGSSINFSYCFLRSPR